MIIAKFVAVVVLGYLIGSIPFGVIVGRWMAKVDVRKYGSGKMGTTNVLRTAGRKAALAVVSLDVFKGVAAVMFAGLIIGGDYLMAGGFGVGRPAALALAALAAIAGHIWPVFLKFRGGRGVATFFGGLVALCPPAAIFGSEVFVIGTGLSGYASLGSIAGVVGTFAILAPVTIINGFPVEDLGYGLLGAVIIVVMHRDNIGRLLSGRERKISYRAERPDPPLPAGNAE